jgi:hypothetical protein
MTIANTARPRKAGASFDVAAIKAANPIAKVIGSRIQLKTNGNELESICPFHTEKTASFTAVPAKGFAHCFGCGWHGDQIDFVMDFHGVDFAAACDILGGNRAAPASRPTLQQLPQSVDYYADLKPAPMSAAPVVAAGQSLRLWNAKRGKWQTVTPDLVHPYHGAGLIGYVLRLQISPTKKWTPQIRFAKLKDGTTGWAIWPFESPRPLYGLDRLIKRPDAPVILPEGEKCSDAADRLLPEYVSLSWPGGGKSIKRVDLSPLAGRDVTIWPDAHAEGEATAMELADLVKAAGAKSVTLLAWDKSKPDCWDIADAEHDGWSADRIRDWIKANTIAAATLDEGPLPLTRPLLEPAPFPIDVLGDVLRSAALAIHEMTRAPLAVCGQSVLAAGSLIAQAHVDVLIRPGSRPSPTSLYFVTVADSSERKTSADDLALKPIRDFEDAQRLTIEADHLAFRNRHEVWNKARSSIINAPAKRTVNAAAVEADLRALGAEPTPPPKPIVLTPEPTIEGLIKMFRDALGFAGLFSGEGGAFLGGFGMSADHRLKTAAHLSSLWDGTPIGRTRQSDELMTLYGRRLAVHLLLQPNIAEKLFSDDDLIRQGLLSRVLVAAPKPAAGTRLYQEASARAIADHGQYVAAMRRLLDLPRNHAQDRPAELTPRVLTLSTEAMRIWIAFHDSIERQLGPDGPLAPIKGFAGKLPEHAARIAAVLTFVDDPDAEGVSGEKMAAGIALAQHYQDEALRLFEAGATNGDLLLAEKVRDWIREQGGTVSLRSLYQYGPNRVRDAATARRILGILTEARWTERLEAGAVIDGKHCRDVWRLIGGQA